MKNIIILLFILAGCSISKPVGDKFSMATEKYTGNYIKSYDIQREKWHDPYKKIIITSSDTLIVYAKRDIQFRKNEVLYTIIEEHSIPGSCHTEFIEIVKSAQSKYYYRFEPK